LLPATDLDADVDADADADANVDIDADAAAAPDPDSVVDDTASAPPGAMLRWNASAGIAPESLVALVTGGLGACLVRLLCVGQLFAIRASIDSQAWLLCWKPTMPSCWFG
jgi:hypothetical protein